MIEMSMINNYLTPEFLHLLLFDQSRIIIKYFEYQKSWDNLFQLLEPFYQFDELDSREFNNADFLPIYLQQLNEGFKRFYLYLPVADEKILDILHDYPEIPFITLLETPTFTYNFEKFPIWVIFNNKTGKFEEQHLQRDDFKSQQTIKWVNEHLMPKIRNSLVEATNYLALMKNSMETLFELAADFHPQAYHRLISPFDSTEEFVFLILTELYYKVDLSNVRKILADEMQQETLDKIDESITEKYDDTKQAEKPKKTENTVNIKEKGKEIKNLEESSESDKSDKMDESLPEEVQELMDFLDNQIVQVKKEKSKLNKNKNKKNTEKSAKTKNIANNSVKSSTIDIIQMPQDEKNSNFDESFKQNLKILKRKLRCIPENLDKLQEFTKNLQKRVEKIIKINCKN